MLSLFVFVFVLLHLSDCVVRLPVRRHVVPTSGDTAQSPSPLSEEAQSLLVDVPVEHNSVLFAHVVELKFGMSRAPARLLIDTGSPDTMVLIGTLDVTRFKTARGNQPGQSYADYTPFIDPSYTLELSPQAKHFACEDVQQANQSWCANTALKWACENQPCTLFEAYGDNSKRIGVVVRDTVQMPLAALQLDFMEAIRISGGHLSSDVELAMDGILGLSPSDERFHLRSTLDQLMDEGAIEHRMFALCLTDTPIFNYFGTADDDGDLVFGAPHTFSDEQLNALPHHSEFTVPLLMNVTSPDDNGTFTPRYLITVTGVQMDTMALPFTPSLALVDSGTVRTIVPAELYSAIADFIKSLCSGVLRRSLICRVDNAVKLFGQADPFSDDGWSQIYVLQLTASDVDQIPSVRFQVEGGEVQLDWQHMFFPQRVGPRTLFGFALQRSTEKLLILGNGLMRSYRTVFNVDAQTLTFATPSVCGPPRDRDRTLTYVDATIRVDMYSADESGVRVLGFLVQPWLLVVFAVGTCIVLTAIALAIAIICKKRRRQKKKIQPIAAIENQAPLAQNDEEEQKHMQKLADSLI
jgi:hypothetical protein